MDHGLEHGPASRLEGADDVPAKPALDGTLAEAAGQGGGDARHQRRQGRRAPGARSAAACRGSSPRPASAADGESPTSTLRTRPWTAARRPATSARMRSGSAYPCGTRARKSGVSSGSTSASDVGQRGLDVVGVEGVPDVEEEQAAGGEHAAHLAVGRDLVGEEHHPELAGHQVEGVVGEVEVHRVGDPPGRRPAPARRRTRPSPG